MTSRGLPSRSRHLATRAWRRSSVRGAGASVDFMRRGVRIHPSARLDGPLDAFDLTRGAVISERCVLAAEVGAGIRLGRDVWLGSDVDIASTGLISIGIGTTVQRRSSFNGNVTIGAGCIIAPNVFISSGTHVFDEWPPVPIQEQERRMEASGRAKAVDRPVTVHEDCWIGINAVISPGVTVGRGAVIGANSVVTRDVAPYEIVGGSPARRIRTRLDWCPPTELDATHESAIPYLVSGFDLAYDATISGQITATLSESATIALGVPDGATEVLVRVTVRCTGATSLDFAGTTHSLSAGTHTIDGVFTSTSDAVHVPLGTTPRMAAPNLPGRQTHVVLISASCTQA